MAGFRDDMVLDGIKRDLNDLINLLCNFEMSADMQVKPEQRQQLLDHINERKVNLKSWIDSDQVRPDKYEAITKQRTL
jgi:hypothetical protein